LLCSCHERSLTFYNSGSVLMIGKITC
jgi:hypothetical protein